jgi:hypothetical protein
MLDCERSPTTRESLSASASRVAPARAVIHRRSAQSAARRVRVEGAVTFKAAEKASMRVAANWSGDSAAPELLNRSGRFLVLRAAGAGAWLRSELHQADGEGCSPQAADGYGHALECHSVTNGYPRLDHLSSHCEHARVVHDRNARTARPLTAQSSVWRSKNENTPQSRHQISSRNVYVFEYSLSLNFQYPSKICAKSFEPHAPHACSRR